MAENYFKYHVFMCLNQRDDGGQCCGDYGSDALQAYAKKRLKALDAWGKNRIRVNKAGCLDRCSQGPVMVVYPEGVWYSFIDQEDIDEIIDEHLLQGRIVERLLVRQG